MTVACTAEDEASISAATPCAFEEDEVLMVASTLTDPALNETATALASTPLSS